MLGEGVLRGNTKSIWMLTGGGGGRELWGEGGPTRVTSSGQKVSHSSGGWRTQRQ